MNKSSFLLALLLIANPFILLFFQNCSVLPQIKSIPLPLKSEKVQTPVFEKSAIRYTYEKSF